MAVSRHCPSKSAAKWDVLLTSVRHCCVRAEPPSTDLARAASSAIRSDAPEFGLELGAMAVDNGLLGMAGLLIDLRQQDSDPGETPRTAQPTPKPASSILTDLAHVVKAQGCGYETSDSTLKRWHEEDPETEDKHLKRMRRKAGTASQQPKVGIERRRTLSFEELEANTRKLC